MLKKINGRKLLALKFLLFPRMMTPYDMAQLIKSVNLKWLKEFGKELPEDIEERFVVLTLYRAKELVDTSTGFFIMKKDDAEYWAWVRKQLIKTMLDDEQLREFVELAMSEWLAITMMLVMLYARENISFFKKGVAGEEVFKLDEEAVKALLTGILDEELCRRLESEGKDGFLKAYLATHALMLKLLLKFATEEERTKLLRVFGGLLRYEGILTQTRPNSKTFLEALHALLTVPLNLLIQLKVHGKSDEEVERIEKTILRLLEETAPSERSFRDLAVPIERVALGVKDVEELREIGLRILSEKLDISLFGVTERVIPRIPVESGASEIQSFRVVINLVDELSEIGIAEATQEALRAAVNWALEAKLIGAYRLIYDKEYRKMYFEALKDPLASVPLMVLYGPPLARFFDLLKFFRTPENKLLEDARAIITDLIAQLKESLSGIREAVKEGMPEQIRRIAFFPIYREAFYISSKMDSELRTELEKLKEGKELISILEEIYSEYGKLREVKREIESAEEISDLYA